MKISKSMLALFCVCLILLLSYLEPMVMWHLFPPKKNGAVLTIGYLRNLEDSLAYVQKLTGKTFEEHLGTNRLDSRAINAQLVSLFKEVNWATFVPVSSNGQAVFVDGRGRPLRFLTAKSPEVTNVCAALRNQQRSILIWSTGPDAKNNWGAGDDVFWKK